MKGDLERSRLITRTAACVALISVGSWIAIPIGPVPVSLQTLMVLLTGILMKRSAWLPMTVYLVVGVCGVPVFHNGMAGPGVLLGPTGGYLLGFVPAGVITGFAYEFSDRFVHGLGLALGVLVIYLPGVLWLSWSSGIGLPAAVAVGVIPFIPGDAVKAGVAFLMGERLKRGFGERMP